MTLEAGGMSGALESCGGTVARRAGTVDCRFGADGPVTLLWADLLPNARVTFVEDSRLEELHLRCLGWIENAHDRERIWRDIVKALGCAHE